MRSCSGNPSRIAGRSPTAARPRRQNHQGAKWRPPQVHRGIILVKLVIQGRNLVPYMPVGGKRLIAKVTNV